MSTSTRTLASIRQGGPGAAHENAKDPTEIPKPLPIKNDGHSKVSGGGGERDRHHFHDAARKGGRV
ncbi:hypothetical protein EDC65_4685 [Stella humosa]|uniref:Uncharacterized protein n=1 Tax=Stella humosa TaxID=94 RepID=A0A3N1KT34_9PROT|nr:hypothetical protein [Stella humosa]ROP83154.1 hypothetical protein EDC65_4685 [Stella humosa]BBK30069.1 hypothetical protein STHU_07030 [Stella humosa]